MVPPIIFSDDVNLSLNCFSEHVLDLMNQIGKSLKGNSQVSGDQLITEAVERRLLKKQCEEPGHLCDDSRRLIYAIVACLTMLFISEALQSQPLNRLLISVPNAKETAISSLDISVAQRPIFESLSSFGDVLPTLAPSQENTDLTGLLHVSNLDASTLTRIGNIQIRWVTCIGSHLDFDVVSRQVSLFSCPTFCQLHTLDDSVFSR